MENILITKIGKEAKYLIIANIRVRVTKFEVFKINGLLYHDFIPFLTVVSLAIAKISKNYKTNS